MKCKFCRARQVSIALWVMMLLSAGLAAAGPSASAQLPNCGVDEPLHTLHVQGNVWMIVGAGGNVAVQVGDQGVLVVDTGLKLNAVKLLAAIHQIAGDRRVIRYVIDTAMDADHIGGNEIVRKAGETIMGGNVERDDFRGKNGATVFASENAGLRMIEPDAKNKSVPQALWPTETIATDTYDFFFNGEAVMLIHPHNAHTDGDLIVFFRKSDVIVAGDIYINTTFPVIDIAHGGGITGIVEGLNDIIDIAVPADKEEGGTLVIPGHGRLADEADVVEVRDMITIIRDRIRFMSAQGKSLAEVQAAKPTFDYDGRYGAVAGDWTSTQFVDAIYRTLAPVKDHGG